MPFARAGFAAVAVAWVVLVITSPVRLLGTPVSGFVYAFGSLICHQRPERSFYVGVSQLPICARCAGLYVGAGAAALLFFAAWRAVRDTLGRDRLRAWLVAAALPTAVTWLSEIAGVWAPCNATRFLAAVPLGAAIALTVNYVECARPQRKASRLPPTPI